MSKLPQNDTNFDQLSPLPLPNKLAPSPKNAPRYGVRVKNSNGEEVELGDPKCTRLLVALMNQHAVNGGAAAHWGGPAAFAEIMASVHGIMFSKKEGQWWESYNFVNDAGHTENGVYALRGNYGFDNLSFEELYKFRSIESKLTGHGEAHLNPEGVYISNGPLGSGLPQAQGLALADRVLRNSRTTICTISDGASMEGEAKESFSAIPGLAKKGQLNPFLLIISDNNTKLSGRIDEDAFGMGPSFEAMENLGWNVLHEKEGNDLEKVYHIIEKGLKEAKANPEKPVCLHITTVKGFGVKSTEESASGGHGYPIKGYDEKLIPFLEEIWGGDLPEEFSSIAKSLLKKPEAKKNQGGESSVKKEKVQPGFARAAIRASQEGLPVFSVSADLQGSTGIKGFHQEYPNRFVDLGVAESNVVSTGAGLSKQGLIPIVDTFAQFGITKGNLPLMMGNLSEAPVIALFSHTGFQDAADGASHQSTHYFSAVSSIPHTQVVSVSCSEEAYHYMYQALHNFSEDRKKGKTPDSVVFFFGRENHPAYYVEGLKYEWGKAQVLKEGKDVTIISTGPMVPKALAAYDLLKENGIEATIINNSFVNHPDLETMGSAIEKTGGNVITIEDHQLIGGMGAQVIHGLALKGNKFNVKCLANEGKFGQSAYLADHLYEVHNLTPEALLKSSKELLKG